MSTARRMVKDVLAKRDLNTLELQALGAAATVVLGEEQRTANLIAWHRSLLDDGQYGEASRLALEIREALK